MRSIRSAVALVALVAATATTAVAEEKPGFGVNTGVAGFVVASTLQAVNDVQQAVEDLQNGDVTKSHGTNEDDYDLTGSCTFAVTGVGNTIFVRYSGTAFAKGPEIPGVSVMKCIVYNGTDSAEVAYALPGGVGAAAAIAGPWEPKPITVCTEGYAAFTPSGHLELLERKCTYPQQ